jgi:hypothetical protein
MLLPSAAAVVSHWLGDELGMAACLTGATQSAHEGETQARRYLSEEKSIDWKTLKSLTVTHF